MPRVFFDSRSGRLFPVSRSQSIASGAGPRSDCEANTRPSELKARLITSLECPRSDWRSRPLRTSHILMTLSAPPVASSDPSGLKATPASPDEVVKTRICFPLDASQSLAVLSRLAVANILPSGLNASERCIRDVLTQPRWSGLGRGYPPRRSTGAAGWPLNTRRRGSRRRFAPRSRAAR
jgi:hypothetical protein